MTLSPKRFYHAVPRDRPGAHEHRPVLVERHDRRRRAARCTPAVEHEVDAGQDFGDLVCGDSAGATPDGFALVAVTQKPNACASSRATACAGTRIATVVCPPSAARDSAGPAGTTMDSGPGQKASASRIASGAKVACRTRLIDVASNQRNSDLAVSALELEQPRHGGVRKRIRGDPVNRIGGERHEPTRPNDRCGLGDASQRQARRRKPLIASSSDRSAPKWRISPHNSSVAGAAAAVTGVAVMVRATNPAEQDERQRVEQEDASYAGRTEDAADDWTERESGE